MRSDPAEFEPVPLGKRDLEVTVTPGMRAMPSGVVNEFHDRKHAMLDRFKVHNPRFLVRLRNYVIGSTIAFPLITIMFVPTDLSKILLQIPIAGLFGIVLAYLRPTGLRSGLLCVVFGMLTMVLCGPERTNFPIIVCTILFYLSIGFAIGAQEDMKAMDGS